MSSGRIDIDAIFSLDTWNKQVEEDIKPVISAIINDAFEQKKLAKFASGLQVKTIQPMDLASAIDNHIRRISHLNGEIYESLASVADGIADTKSEDDKYSHFRRAAIEIYANVMAKDQIEIADNETRLAWKFGQSD